MGVSSDAAPAPKPPGSARVILTVFLYLGLNSSLNLLNRYTLGMAGFKFPVSLTHAPRVSDLRAGTDRAPAPRGQRDAPRGREATVARQGLFAIGTFMAVNISLNNASLLHLSLSYNQVIRASIPVVCAACAVLVEKKIPTALEALGLALVAAGVMATVAGSTSQLEQRPNEVTGLIFCVVATVSNALMMTFSGKIARWRKVGRGVVDVLHQPGGFGVITARRAGLEWEKMTMRLRRGKVWRMTRSPPPSWRRRASSPDPAFCGRVLGVLQRRGVQLGAQQSHRDDQRDHHHRARQRQSRDAVSVLARAFSGRRSKTWAMACGAGASRWGFGVFVRQAAGGEKNDADEGA